MDLLLNWKVKFGKERKEKKAKAVSSEIYCSFSLAFSRHLWHHFVKQSQLVAQADDC